MKEINKELIGQYIQKRARNSEKRDFGHALLIGGSYGMMGAIQLSALASLRSGAGLVSVLAPLCGYEILQSTVPEAMIVPSSDREYLERIPDLKNFRHIGVGPGIGLNRGTRDFIDILLRHDRPLVIDADALNIIAENQWQQRIPEGSLITPNLREFNRLFNPENAEADTEHIQLKNAEALKISILLKGPATRIVFADGSIYRNTSGNPGMAKGGSGDVLTGIITGLWTRLNNLEQASLAGVYLHGLAGDIAAKKQHEESMLARDIIECLSGAFKSIQE